MVVGVLAAALSFFSDLVSAVTFTGVLIVVEYALVALSAPVSRMCQRGLARPWRMPLWPVPPEIALAGVGIAISQQKVRDLLIVVGIFAVGAVNYALFLRPRSSTHWRDPGGLPSSEQPGGGPANP